MRTRSNSMPDRSGSARGATAHIREHRVAVLLGRSYKCAIERAQRNRHRQVETFEQSKVPWRVVTPRLHEPAIVGDPTLALEPERMASQATDFEAVGVERISLEGTRA
jgi:hypothetical protein